MKVLVLGNGGREHTLCWKIKQSTLVAHVYCAPGNAGTAGIAENIPLKLSDLTGILSWTKKNSIDLVVVGPEAPLAAGIVDLFRSEGIAIFGPTKAAARLESSKAFAKQFMKTHRIPTADSKLFHSGQLAEIRAYLRDISYPRVLKADGLAAGKGVVIASTYLEAVTAAESMLSGEAFGDAGKTVVVEEYLEGIEASVFAIADGTRFITLSPAQDHKRILDNDLGKNTGGMGAFAPSPHVPTDVLADIKLRVIIPTLEGMAKEGTPYTGVLFAGMILTADGPKVLEFNCRFGDPEAQVVLPLVDDDLAAIFRDAALGQLQSNKVRLHDANAVCVVIASSGYPDAYDIGKRVAGLDSINEAEEGVIVFHAGTAINGHDVVTSGGRVFAVTALGEGRDFQPTIRLAYNAVNRIRFDGAYYRTDIGRKALIS